jgi:hypothetical protein
MAANAAAPVVYSASRRNVSWCVSVKRWANSRFSALRVDRAGETGAERADVFVVAAVACAEVVGDLLHDLVGDSLGAHAAKCAAGHPVADEAASSLRRCSTPA